MIEPRSTHGRQLWRLLPEVYRARDEGDLAAYLDALGALLDRVRETLDQRLADSFPDTPGEDEGEPAQAWLLPYFARLLDARLLSPHVEGRRREVSEAISWRQRRGTRRAVEEIAEAMTGRRFRGSRGREVEVQEGFQRVLTTARIGLPILPPVAFGVRDPDLERPRPSPSVASRHPGLAAGTADFRTVSRAIRADADHPLAHISGFAGPGVVAWRQHEPRGAPCFPGSYQDVSVRTADVRSPGPRQGHAHPKRALLFVSPAGGFFRVGHSSRRGAPDEAPQELSVTLGTDEEHVLEERRIKKLTLNQGRLRLRACTVDELVVDAPPPAEGAAVVEANACRLGTVAAGSSRLRLERCTITGAVEVGRLFATRCLGAGVTAGAPCRVDRCAFADLRVGPATGERPPLIATHSLFRVLRAGAARLEYCTVLGDMSVQGLAASDCIFAGELVDEGSDAVPSCVRFSRIARSVTAPAGLGRFATTTATPVFLVDDAAFAVSGSGVLDARTPAAVRFGAEDGGEMGAYHDEAHSLEERALLDKVAEQLPFGMEAVLIPDPLLLKRPPAVSQTDRGGE